MFDYLRFFEQVLYRGETLTPRECVSAIALLTLLSYLLLMISGRGKS